MVTALHIEKKENQESIRYCDISFGHLISLVCENRMFPIKFKRLR